MDIKIHKIGVSLAFLIGLATLSPAPIIEPRLDKLPMVRTFTPEQVQEQQKFNGLRSTIGTAPSNTYDSGTAPPLETQGTEGTDAIRLGSKNAEQSGEDILKEATQRTENSSQRSFWPLIVFLVIGGVGVGGFYAAKGWMDSNIAPPQSPKSRK